jgi:S-adenosylmethionine:tRNA ribosyltransferase-isomerase
MLATCPLLSDLRTDDFDFPLPHDLIAQEPVTPRDHARLLHVKLDGFSDHRVFDLPDLLRAGDVLVMNDTRVIPARLYGRRSERPREAQSKPALGGDVKVEILLHKKEAPQTWLAFARPGKRLHVGDHIVFAPDFAVEVIEKRETGEILLRFSAADEDFFPLLERYGDAPLPPYIKRETGASPDDRERYQTIYAARDGAIAAPTAGLHFTPELLARLQAKGIKCAIVTLHVGAGTFLPVKADFLKDHVMHAEWGEIAPGIAAYLNKVKGEGRRLIAVGTTSLRLLEAASDESGVVRAFCGETDLFIAPGYRFKIVDALLTNFHLPRSTLFMLVSAFAGMAPMRKAYEYARKQRYRFYSYGDATLLEKA